MPLPTRCILLLAALATAGTAQTAPDSKARITRTGLQSYSESVSRDLFAACDEDSDDRLDVFEAGDALDGIRGPKDSAGFARFDTDRDGFVSWPEFDQQFWNIAQRGGSFRVRPCRSLVETAPERQAAQPMSPLQAFLRLHDRNGNGGLDPDEIEDLVRTAGLPPTLGGQMRAQDHDGSGRIEEAELAPWFELLRGVLPFALRPPTAEGPLPPPWQAADTGGDGAIDVGELAAMLRRLDASLVRWAPQLLRELDKDGNGRLEAKELPATEPAVRHGTALNLPRRSEPAPQVSRVAPAGAVPDR